MFIIFFYNNQSALKTIILQISNNFYLCNNIPRLGINEVKLFFSKTPNYFSVIYFVIMLS